MSKSAITMNPPVHAGEILKEEFLVPLEHSTNKLAKHIKVPSNRLTAIINGQRGITGDTVLHLSRALNTTPEFWMNIQMHYELECAKDHAEFEFSAISTEAA